MASERCLAVVALLLAACAAEPAPECLSCVDGLGPIELWIPPDVSDETADDVGRGANELVGSECFRVVRDDWQGGDDVPPGVIAMEVGMCPGGAIGCTVHYLPARGFYRVTPRRKDDAHVHLHELAHIMLMRDNEVHTEKCGVLNVGDDDECRNRLAMPEEHVATMRMWCDRLLAD